MVERRDREEKQRDDLQRSRKRPRPASFQPDNHVQRAIRELECVAERLQLSSSRLHLIGREAERWQLMIAMERAIRCVDEGIARSNVIYLSGMPGVGKSTVLHHVLNELRQVATLPSFSVCEVNGCGIHHAEMAYKAIWNALNPSEAHERLEKTRCEALNRVFRSAAIAERRSVMVLILDEIDVLVGEEMVRMIYNIIEWSSKKTAKLVVVAVANKMELPEELQGKIESRFTGPRIVFSPYTSAQLLDLVQQRIGPLRVFQQDVLQLCTKSIARASGDAREALNQCRRAVGTRLRSLRTTHERQVAVSFQDFQQRNAIGSDLDAFLRSSTRYESMALGVLVKHVDDVGNAVALEIIQSSMQVQCRVMGVQELPSTAAYLRLFDRLEAAGLITQRHLSTWRLPMIELCCGAADLAAGLMVHSCFQWVQVDDD